MNHCWRCCLFQHGIQGTYILLLFYPGDWLPFLYSVLFARLPCNLFECWCVFSMLTLLGIDIIDDWPDIDDQWLLTVIYSYNACWHYSILPLICWAWMNSITLFQLPDWTVTDNLDNNGIWDIIWFSTRYSVLFTFVCCCLYLLWLVITYSTVVGAGIIVGIVLAENTAQVVLIWQTPTTTTSSCNRQWLTLLTVVRWLFPLLIDCSCYLIAK